MQCLERRTRLLTFVWLTLFGTSAAALATPSLLVDADTGAVLHQEEATTPWYPASLTKLVTAYVALKAVKDGKASLDQPLVVSVRAMKESPSKMGFRPGTIVTLDNALKMLMVKSANDMAVTIAEGLGGSVEGFADQMNGAAQSLGMKESHFVNPNGLPDPRHISSARDMAVVARALINEFPEHRGLFGIGALRLGNQIINTHNGLIGRYPGADGMKTGFTCSAGFNLVASATRGNRHLISVVLGSSTVRNRNQRVADLLEAGFNGTEAGTAQLDALPTTPGEPPDRHEETCTRRAQAAANDEAAEITASTSPQQAPVTAQQASKLFEFGATLQTPSAPPPATAATANVNLLAGAVQFDPVPVYIGPAPGWTGPLPEGGRPSSDLATAYAPQRGGAAAAAAAAAAGPARLSHARSLRSVKGSRPAAKTIAKTAAKSSVVVKGKPVAKKAAGKAKADAK